jgi:6-phosphogluconolactonase
MTARRLTRRGLFGLGAAGVTALGVLPRPLTGVRTAMAEGTPTSTPDTVVYVSNAGGPEIHVLAMNRTTGDLDLIEKVEIPDLKPSPTSMPMALSPDRKFLHAAVRSEPFSAASFKIDPASGRLSHLGNAPLDASMAYTTIDKTGRWLLCASYPNGEITVN